MLMYKNEIIFVIRRPSGAVRDVKKENRNGGILGIKLAVLEVMEDFPDSAIIGWRGRSGVRQIPAEAMP